MEPPFQSIGGTDSMEAIAPLTMARVRLLRADRYSSVWGEIVSVESHDLVISFENANKVPIDALDQRLEIKTRSDQDRHLHLNGKVVGIDTHPWITLVTIRLE